MRNTTLLSLMLTLPYAAASADSPTLPPPAVTGTVQLGDVEVKSLRATVELLEEMKTAIRRPFDDSPAHYDDMVCLLKDNSGFRAQGMVLECGTQGWFGMQREIHNRDMSVTADPSLTTTPNLGHPWHVERLLDHEQLAALRKVLGVLPEPGKGDVQVVDDLHGTAAPSTATAQPAASSTNPR
jgi:hypothetical protein